MSVPLQWRELSGMEERPTFSIANFPDWQHRLRNDPWREMVGLRQNLSAETLERFTSKAKRS